MTQPSEWTVPMPTDTRSGSSRILLFRFHSDVVVARERLRIIRHFNPGLPCYALFGGSRADVAAARAAVADLVTDFWWFDEDRDAAWKWRNGDLMVKAWYRAVGRDIDFGFVYNYEYDLLVTAALDTIFPAVDERTVCVGGLQEFTPHIYDSWYWTSGNGRDNYLRFERDMFLRFGVGRQRYVCLGPGMLFPKAFLDVYCDQADTDLVNDELRIPAFAEALGFGLAAHAMSPGFGPVVGELRYFNCANSGTPTKADVLDVLSTRTDRRSFHPVKYLMTIENLPEPVRAGR